MMLSLVQKTPGDIIMLNDIASEMEVQRLAYETSVPAALLCLLKYPKRSCSLKPGFPWVPTILWSFLDGRTACRVCRLEAPLRSS